ncbi:HNH endonuclease signature motif containing protein [Geodermatophilus dictyosporus]|nr:HNH endonuclease signature motif containing protein [Geodermatophilus dictyosporus]
MEEDQPPAFAGGLLGLLGAGSPELRRLPVALLSREQKAAELERLQAVKAMTAAYEAELVLGLADDSPDDLDAAPGTPGAKRGSWAPDPELPGVSEFFTAELAVVLDCGHRSASLLAQRAWVYRESLPGTWGALAEGTLDEARAKVLVDVLQHTDPAVARQVESRLLPEAATWTTHTLRKRAVAALLAVDADAVDARRREAERQADVRVHPSPREGMSTLAADLPAPAAAACFDLVDQLAVLLKKDGDERPVGQLRAAVLADLVQRPWDDSRPPVTAHLQLIATLSALAGESSEAGEVNGLPITIGQLRELLARLDRLGVRTPAGGSVTLALTDDDGALRATTTLDRLRRLARRGCPAHQGAGCGCAVLDRPAEVDGYAPSAAQQTFVHNRDRSCRFPGCGQRVGWADADHVVPHACGGPTDCANLCCLCRSHHRLKTFAPGWHFQMSPDGVLTVTTPSGITRTTRPPGMRPPGTQPPGTQPAPPPPDPDGDPPPF